MSTENELKKLIADYGKDCISAGIADIASGVSVKTRMAEDVLKSHAALTGRLRALLTELEAAREDAARYRLRLETIRALYPSAPSNIELDTAIDAARKGAA